MAVIVSAFLASPKIGRLLRRNQAGHLRDKRLKSCVAHDHSFQTIPAPRPRLAPPRRCRLQPAAGADPGNENALPTRFVTPQPDAWQSAPITPKVLSQRARDIVARGQALGRNPQAFSKVGDCGGTPAWFLGP